MRRVLWMLVVGTLLSGAAAVYAAATAGTAEADDRTSDTAITEH
ncbi:hypothetical protein [Sphingomonas sp.]|nr:hypothetical protein [Sphingomonas sp.]